jgi:uracil phosphoribosyltransferase
MAVVTSLSPLGTSFSIEKGDTKPVIQEPNLKDVSQVFYTHVKNPVLESHVLRLRDPKTKRATFRSHMRKVGEYLAFSLAPALPTKIEKIETVLKAEASHKVIDTKVVLVSILRAGLPLVEGMRKIFPKAKEGFLGYQRDEKTFQPHRYANPLPKLKDKTVIVGDPMIATGGSMKAALEQILAKNPKDIYVVGAIAAKPGLEAIHKAYPKVHIYAAAIDPELNEKAYIVPGLGDAGDRSFGLKDEG